jgi:hypothetical protein
MKLSNNVKVSLVTAVCILVLAVISRKIINVQLDFVSLYGPVWVYMAYIISRDKTKKSKICSSPLFWSLAIIFVTLAVLIVYAI